jgi:membrane-associated protease RseP (regulator of RpoE activity)
MKTENAGPPRTLFVLASALILAWGVAGFFNRRDSGTQGYFFGPDRIVTGVSEGGSGEAAGIQVGDRLVSVQGTPAEELPMQSRWAQPRSGEKHTLVFDRDGERFATEITYQPQSRDPTTQFLKVLIVGLSFLGFGLWSLVSVPTLFGRLTAYLCLALAYGLFQGPHLGSWDGMSSGVEFAAAILGLGLMAQFFLLFPKPKKAGLNPTVRKVFWITYFLFVALLVVEILVHPALYTVYGVVTTVLVMATILLSLGAAGHSVVKIRGKARGDSGMSLVALGLIIAMGPPLVQMVIGAVIPDFSLPGSDSFELLLAAIPIGLFLGVRRHSRMETPLI